MKADFCPPRLKKKKSHVTAHLLFHACGSCHSQTDLDCWDKLSPHYTYFRLQFKSNYANLGVSEYGINA